MSEDNTNTVDKDLVGKALLGDQHSFSLLMERYYDPVYIYILQIIDNPDDAEDITQETFNKAFRNLSTYNSEWAFSTWLITIAKNSALDFYRKIRTRSNAGISIREDSSELITAAEMAQSPEEKMISRQTCDQLVNSLKKLGLKYRRVAELRFIHEYAYEEIARELNIPVNTVRTRLNRARKHLIGIWKK
ncbi:MAG: sigma-70 family RNA polymerase sigma factor [Bacteroidales bacterium]|nr:sigma-70 family RNA polymerase sigma factor [Bacteroidales bacterium]MDD2424734.1 sigma-70 family RNA polymerase sigma factor [Bacteroidales bacterium]MDD3989301.1 sigma-70 family RNA polymerase sigma factor [Bacteroidales bacterium]